MKTLMKGLILVPALMFVLVGTAYAATLVVRPDPGSGEYDSIWKAVSNSGDGDTVLVYPGVYLEKNVKITQNNLTLKSTGGPLSTVIQAPNKYYVVRIVGHGSTVDGFTIINAHTWKYRRGLQIRGGSTTIKNNFFTGSALGIWDYSRESEISSEITNNVFSDNTIAGIIQYAPGGNEWPPRLGDSFEINSHITNNTFAYNGQWGINISAEGNHITSTIANNVFYANGPNAKGNGGAIGVWDTGEDWGSGVMAAPTIKYNIMATYPLDTWDWDLWPVASFACIVDHGTLGDMVLEANLWNVDPLLISDVNYHVKPGSPCIDAGTIDVIGLQGTDFDGNPRSYDGDLDGTAVVDMGAYEFGAWHEALIPETLAVVGTLDVPSGIRLSLDTKLNLFTALVDKAIDAKRSNKSNADELVSAAYNGLGAFTHEVYALYNAGSILGEEADDLVEACKELQGYLMR